MPLLLSIEPLAKGAVSLKGELPLNELVMVSLDNLVEPAGPLEYNLVAEKNGDSILLEGSLKMSLKCECARCLQAYEPRIERLNWSCLLPLNGEDSLEKNRD